MKRLILLIVVLLALPVWAADVYVDGTWGGTESGTEAEPYNTIAEGITAAGDTGTVYIKASGTYAETLAVGAISITLQGYSSTIDDEGIATIDDGGTSASGIVWTGPSSDVLTLKNLQVSSFTSHGISVGSWGGYGIVRLYNCRIIDNGGDGVYNYDGSNGMTYALNSVFADNSGNGVNSRHTSIGENCLYFKNGVNGSVSYFGLFSRCVFVANTDDGVEISASGGPAILTNCIMDSNGGHGFLSSGVDTVYGMNNIFIRNGAYGHRATAWFAATINPIWGSGAFANTSGGGSNSWAIMGEGDLSADPFLAIYNSSTNNTWEGQDYRIDTANALFDTRTPDYESPHVDSYDTIGPQQEAPDGAVYVSAPGDLNPTALDEDTASQVAYVLLVDSSDNTTPETGVSGPTITISKAGGAFASPSDGTWTEIGNGLYTIGLDATDTSTAGILITKVVATGCADDYELLQVGSSTAPSASTVAAAVWEVATSGLTSAGSVGKAVVDIESDATAILADTGTDGVVLANDAITAAKIAADAIGSSEIATDAIGAAEVAAGALVAGTEITGLADSETIGTDVWASTTRTLTAATLTSGTLANSGDAATYKADVSGLATSTELGDVQTHGDSAWATATGFSTFNPATDGVNVDSIDTDAITADALAADAVSEIDAAWNAALTELTTDPGATPTPRQVLALIYMANRNRVDTTSDTLTYYNDAGEAVFTIGLSDDGSTFTRAEMADAE